MLLDAKCADADAVVLLENTKVLNYINGDRHVGFNVQETVAILKVESNMHSLFSINLNDTYYLQSLAKFHALGIAMRRLQPKLFEAHVSPQLDAVNLILNDEDTQMVDVCIVISVVNSFILIDLC